MVSVREPGTVPARSLGSPNLNPMQFHEWRGGKGGGTVTLDFRSWWGLG